MLKWPLEMRARATANPRARFKRRRFHRAAQEYRAVIAGKVAVTKWNMTTTGAKIPGAAEQFATSRHCQTGNLDRKFGRIRNILSILSTHHIQFITTSHMITMVMGMGRATAGMSMATGSTEKIRPNYDNKLTKPP